MQICFFALILISLALCELDDDNEVDILQMTVCKENDLKCGNWLKSTNLTQLFIASPVTNQIWPFSSKNFTAFSLCSILILEPPLDLFRVRILLDDHPLHSIKIDSPLEIFLRVIKFSVDETFFPHAQPTLRPWVVYVYAPGVHTFTAIGENFDGATILETQSKFWFYDIKGPSHHLRCDPRSVDINGLRTTHFVDIAVKDFQKGVPLEWQPTVECVNRLLREQPDFYLPHLVKAKMLADMGRWTESIEAWEELYPFHRNIIDPVEENIRQFSLLYLDPEESPSLDDEFIKNQIEELKEINKTYPQPKEPFDVGWVEVAASDRHSEDYLESVKQHQYYLSLILVMHYDNVSWCQWTPDHCIDRFAVVVNTALHLLTKHNISAEMIVIDWVPVPGFRSIRQIIRERVQSHPSIPIRVVSVSKREHERIWTEAQLNVHQYIAKNAGARRARGEFIVFMNPDSILTSQLVSRLARKKLESEVVYAAFRGEVHLGVPNGQGATGFSMSRYVDLHQDWKLAPPSFYESPHFTSCLEDDAENSPLLHGNRNLVFEDATGDFLIISRFLCYQIRCYPEYPSQHFIDGAIIWIALKHGAGQLLFPPPCGVVHQGHSRDDVNSVFSGKLNSLNNYHRTIVDPLYTDFDGEVNHCPDPCPPFKDRAALQFNDEDWGMRDFDLHEVILLKK